MKKDMAMPGNRTTCLPAMGLTSPGLQLLGGFGGNPLNLASHPTHVVLDYGCTRSIEHLLAHGGAEGTEERVLALHTMSF